jgi:hypothetical protein
MHAIEIFYSGEDTGFGIQGREYGVGDTGFIAKSFRRLQAAQHLAKRKRRHCRESKLPLKPRLQTAKEIGRAIPLP